MRGTHLGTGLLLAALATLGACGGGGDGLPSGAVEEALGVQVYFARGHGGGTSVTGVEAQLGWFDPDILDNVVFSVTPPLDGDEDEETFTLHAGESPVVDEYFAWLTNGVDDGTATGTRKVPGGGGGSSSDAESARIRNRHPALGGPDLAGATITRAELTLTFVAVVTGDPYEYTLVGLVTYYGTIQP